MKKFTDLLPCCRQHSIDNLSMVSITYALERFNKNAMIIFVTTATDRYSRDVSAAIKDVRILKQTFQKYHFETEAHYDFTARQIKQTIDSFFDRDWTDYGAVAVVVLAPVGSRGMLAARDKMFHESIIAKHFNFEKAPESLKHKMKIYITEAYRVANVNDGLQYTLPFTDEYRHILGFHIPQIMVDVEVTPLQIFCQRMSNPKPHDYYALIRIMDGAIRQIEESFPALQGRIEKVCTAVLPCILPTPVSTGKTTEERKYSSDDDEVTDAKAEENLKTKAE